MSSAAGSSDQTLSPPAKKSRSKISDRQSSGEMAQNGSSNEANSSFIDEGLYSRQLYVLGHESMRRMATAEVLVSGMRGLGIEIAKNVILGGVKSVVLHDVGMCELKDLSSQYYLTEEDIGRNRAEASLPKITELNSYVEVSAHTEELTEDFLEKFMTIVLTDSTLEEQYKIGEFAHSHNIALIIADTKGLFGQVFCDFGEKFTIHDVKGEQPLSAMIASISKDQESVVTCLEETRHGFEDGDYVTFSEVQGMVELNGCEPRKVTVIGPYTFSIGDTSKLTDYVRGGIATQVKMPKTISFKSFKESIESPEFIFSDSAKMDRPSQLHLGFQALHMFKQKNKTLPRPWNEEDAAELVSLVQELNEKLPLSIEVDDSLICQLSYIAGGDICPMQAVIGGIATQEVMKACSGKFHPIFQWFYFDSLECLPDGVLDEESVKSKNCRYDGQIAVFGEAVQNKLANLKYFIVGAGAIGCEHLKNFSLMGIGSGEEGKIIITDMDLIERSNLNRQFLFRLWDVGEMKANIARRAVLRMNPEVHIISHRHKVGPGTVKMYNDYFFSTLDGVVNTLDNVYTRLFIDDRCMCNRKPHIESGTLGTKGCTQVVIPYLTESYSSSQVPPEESTSFCTNKTLPTTIEHTIQWARDEFEGLFKQSSENARQYLSEPHYMKRILKLSDKQQLEFLKCIKQVIVDDRPQSFDDCIIWARRHWEEQYNNQIKWLLYNFPPNQKTTFGVDFWYGYKPYPHSLTFDITNSLHLDYIVATANLRAFMYGIAPNNNRNYIGEAVRFIQVPEFVPTSDIRIAVTDSVASQENKATVDVEHLAQLQRELPTPEQLNGLVINPIEFVKDDDSNYHMDFIVAASNLRAENYLIAPADHQKSKLIIGKIIPAIATTTAVVSGLVCLELYKLAQENQDLHLYKNSNINLAVPIFKLSEPISGPENKETYIKFCHPCASVFYTEYEYVGHFLESEHEKALAVKDFVDTIELKRKCTGVFSRNIICTQCMMKFSLSENFMTHMKSRPHLSRMANEHSQLYYCHYCDLYLSTLDEFHIHYNIHM